MDVNDICTFTVDQTVKVEAAKRLIIKIYNIKSSVHQTNVKLSKRWDGKEKCLVVH